MDNETLLNLLRSYPEFKLCLVKGNVAYFTTGELSAISGDDWDDSPYEHNASLPYPKDPDQLLWVFFECENYETPADKARWNSRYSVEQINRGDVAWLAATYPNKPYLPIFAGETLQVFCERIELAGGIVFFPMLFREMQRLFIQTDFVKIKD